MNFNSDVNNSFQPSCDVPFNGIITSLNKKNDVLDHFLSIEDSSTEIMDQRVDAKCLIDRSIIGEERDQNWCSKNEPNQYVIVSFHHFYIIPSYYSFRSKTIDSSFPVSWTVEGSFDNHTWKTVDIKEERTEFYTNNITHIFSLSKTVYLSISNLHKTKDLLHH